ncbi:MAG: nucleotidyl transferase AbiEii/AbiGii toxin family protein [bacterium]
MRTTDVVTAFAPGLLASGIEWMIAGGVAAIVYGEPRITLDVDIVAAIRPQEAAKLTAQFPGSLYYCPSPEIVAEEASRDAFGHFNILHLETDGRADVYLAGQSALARRGLDHRRSIELMGLTVPVAPPEYVILHKLVFRQQGASARHLHDIRSMLRVLGDSVDTTALHMEASDMGLDLEWREMEDLRD